MSNSNIKDSLSLFIKNLFLTIQVIVAKIFTHYIYNYKKFEPNIPMKSLFVIFKHSIVFI
jgi:hypothetical protein